jgi:hypothetical protein
MTDDKNVSPDHTLEGKREAIRQSLNEITAELNSALIREELAYPIYLCVPASGDALATFACPLDPDEQSWNEIVEIVSEIVGKKIGTRRLRTRALACAMAGATIAGADVTVG